MIPFILTNGSTEFGAIIRNDLLELNTEFSFKSLHAMHSRKHGGQGSNILHHLRPGQPRVIINNA